MGAPTTRPGHVRIRLQLQDRPAPLGARAAPYVLATLLGVVATAAAALSLLVPSLLGGAAVTRGNLRGTALVVLVVGVPLMIGAAVRTAQGSARALVLWLGAVAYLLYQSVLFCFMTPFNRLFLLYVAMLGLSLATGLSVLREVDLLAFSGRLHHRLPVRALAATLLAFVGLNAVAWLARIVPTVFADDPSSVLAGGGLQTNAVWVQDLAFWIPAAVVVGVRMWRRRPWGRLLGGALLVFYVIESLSIASDQWWGARADAGQPDLASMTMVPVFGVVALVAAVPLALYVRNVDRKF
jgi:hypothetical protein